MLTIPQYNRLFPEERVWLSQELGRPVSPYDPIVICEGMLLFTEETADSWGGCFEGGYAYCRVCDYSKMLWKDWLGRKDKNNGRLALEVWAEHEKEAKAAAARSIYPEKRIYRKDNDRPSSEFPFKIYLAGTDDTSYSKFYATEAEAMEELNLFSTNEPLDFNEVVKDFKFVFTN